MLHMYPSHCYSKKKKKKASSVVKLLGFAKVALPFVTYINEPLQDHFLFVELEL